MVCQLPSRGIQSWAVLLWKVPGSSGSSARLLSWGRYREGVRIQDGISFWNILPAVTSGLEPDPT